jgi:hypothetical protein
MLKQPADEVNAMTSSRTTFFTGQVLAHDVAHGMVPVLL